MILALNRSIGLVISVKQRSATTVLRTTFSWCPKTVLPSKTLKSIPIRPRLLEGGANEKSVT